MKFRVQKLYKIILHYIKMDVKKICWQGTGRMDVAQNKHK